MNKEKPCESGEMIRNEYAINNQIQMYSMQKNIQV